MPQGNRAPEGHEVPVVGARLHNNTHSALQRDLHGGAQQHVRVAALVHRAGDARVVHFVETLHGLVAVVLSALQQVVHGHGAAVVVDVVAALAVGEDLDALDEAGGVGRGRGQRVGAVRVPDAEGDLDGLGVDEGRAAGQRDAADPRGCGGEGAQRAGEVLHVMPRRHVAGVACFQLVVQALHQLILGSGGDYQSPRLLQFSVALQQQRLQVVAGVRPAKPSEHPRLVAGFNRHHAFTLVRLRLLSTGHRRTASPACAGHAAALL